MQRPDFIVVGLGTVGSAVCRELARRGRSVIGLDAGRPPHRRGSHHGETRSVRRAYMEGTAYVPMAQRAWELWRRLEREHRTRLLVPTGNLTLAPPDAPALTGFLASARAHGIEHQELTAAEVRRRWPLLAPPDSLAAGLEIRAGIVFPEAAVDTMLTAARRAGADLRFDQPVTGWRECRGHVQVRTGRAALEAGRLLLSAGARNPRLLGAAGASLVPKRVPVHWVSVPAGPPFDLGSLPVNFWQLPPSRSDPALRSAQFYCLPAIPPVGRLKTALHAPLADCDPRRMAWEATPAEVGRIRVLLKRYLPALAGREIRSHVCLYTLTPDNDFLLGRIAGHRQVFAAALAGHGFKFAPVLGEVLADLLEGVTPRFDVRMFDPGRFGS